jgi:outer membrane protein assembly factor BamB
VKLTRGIAALASVVLLASCSEELILEGERLDLRAPFGGAVQVAENRVEPISLPGQVNHSEWTHRRGSNTHTIAHPALGPALSLAWSARIGAGDGNRHRITADPVVAGGRSVTLDSRATVSATSATGATLWQADLTPDFARRDNASGGGLAFGAGRLYVTTAFGELVALDPQTGAEAWRQRFDAPASGAPTVAGDTVYVVAADSSAWAIDAANGRVRWQLAGTPSAFGVMGGAGPAIADRLVILPYPSNEIVAALRDGGTRTWATRVAGSRPGVGHGGIRDITGDPVVVGSTIYAANPAGRMAAIDAETGATVWTAREGATGPVWPAGGSLFLVSDIGELVRLDARDGSRIWGVPLPYYTRDRERRRAEVFTHHGPILAGGRLIVASNDGMLRSFDPASGALISELEMPRGATTSPVVVGGTLYVVSTDGQLHAFR